MKNRHRFLIGSLCVITLTNTSRAADASWSLGTGGGNWNNAAAWTPGASPGATSGTTNADTATFNTSTRTVNSTVTVDGGRNIGNITLNTTNGFAYTLSGGSLVLSAGGNVLATGAGTGQSQIYSPMALQGDYTFTANSNLQFNNTAATFTTAASLGAVTMNIGGNWSGGTVLSTGIISQGTGSTLSLAKSGTGSWQLNGVNTFTGGVTVKEGFLGVGNTGGLGTGTLTLGDSSGSNNASAGFGSNVNPTNAINVAAGSSGTLSLTRTGGSGPSTLSGAVSLANNLTISQNAGNAQNFTLSGNITGSGNVSVKALVGTGTTTLSGSSINFTGLLSNDSVSASATTISGSLGANITGVTQNSTVSSLSLTGSNANYAGTTTINQGSVTVSGSGTLGNGTAPLVVNNTNTGAGNAASLTLSTTLDTSVGPLSGTIATPASGTNSATITTQASRNFTVNQTTAGNFAGVIGGAGAFTLGTSSTSKLTLSGINTYSGGTTVRAGILALGHATNTLADSGAVTVSGGTLEIGANSDSVGAVTLTGGSITGTSGVLTGSSYSLETGSISAKLAGNAGLTKSNSGTVTLTGALNTTNTAGSVIRVTGGTSGSNSILTLSPTSASVTGATSNNNSVSIGDGFGDYAVFNHTAGTVSSTSISIGNLGTGTYNLSGGTSGTNSLTMAFTGPFSGTGEAFLNVSGSSALNIQSNGKLTLGSFYARKSTIVQTGGEVSFFSDAGATLGGTGGLAFNGGTGSYTLSGGTLAVPQITLLAAGGGAGGGSGMIDLDGGTLKITGSSFAVPAGVSFNVKGSGAIANSGANIDTYGLSIDFNAGLLHGGPNAIDGGLTKTGAGTLALSGTSTYTGPTTVSTGVLAVNGALANTTTTVGNTARLQGGGSIGGAVTVQNGGTIAAGNSIESLATGALTLEGGSTFAYEIDSDASGGVAGDLTAVSGDLTLDVANTVLLTLSELGVAGSWNAGEKLTLISYSGTWNGGLFDHGGTLADDSIFSFSGTNWQFNYNDTSAGTNYTGDLTGSSFVTMTAVPEPSAPLLAVLGALGLATRRRRNA